MNKTIQFFRELFDSPATQPLLTLWVVGGLTAAMRAAGWFNFGVATFIITLTLIVLILSAFHKELSELHRIVDTSTDQMVQEVREVVDVTKNQLVREVHDVMDSSQDVYINRIIQLTAVLVANDIDVPPEPPKEGDNDE